MRLVLYIFYFHFSNLYPSLGLYFCFICDIKKETIVFLYKVYLSLPFFLNCYFWVYVEKFIGGMMTKHFTLFSSTVEIVSLLFILLSINFNIWSRFKIQPLSLIIFIPIDHRVYNHYQNWWSYKLNSKL